MSNNTPAPVDISQLSLTELEALAYRTAKKIQIETQNLAIIEQRIAQLEAQHGTQPENKN